MKEIQKRTLNLLFFIVIFISISAFCASSASVLLSEIVSRESTADSIWPRFDIDSSGVSQAVWADSTDLESENNGPDLDIFYNYRNAGQWSTRSLENNIVIGGVKVISSSSVTSSMHPDIVVDSKNVTHIVWSALAPPHAISKDNHTLFLMHFDSQASLTSADYAEGSANAIASQNPKLSDNALINSSLLLTKSSHINFSAASNINSTQGTIMFWFNSLEDLRRKSITSEDTSILMYFLNSSYTNKTMFITLIGYHQPTILVFDEYNDQTISSEQSYLYPIKKNEWHHIAVAYNLTDLSNGFIRLYLDGYLTAEKTGTFSGIYDFDKMIIGGAHISLPTYTSDFMMDELMISNKIYSSGEVKAYAGNRSIYYRKLSDKRTLSSQTKLTSGVNLSFYPRISIDPDDNIHLVYNDLHNRTSAQVFYMKKNSTSWSQPELVSDRAFSAYMPDIAVDQNSTAHVVWEEFSEQDWNISYVHYERKKAGGSWSGEINVSNASSNSFAYHSLVSAKVLSSYFPKMPVIYIGPSNITRIAWSDNIYYPDPHLSFYASFNEGFNADYSRGDHIVDSGNVYLTNGTHGGYTSDFFYTKRGVNISNGSAAINQESHLNYSAASNFDINESSISMWFKPYFDPSDASVNHSNVLFVSGQLNAPALRNAVLINFLGFGTSDTNFLIFGLYSKYAHVDLQNNAYVIALSSQSFSKDQWHHLGFSWNANNASGNREMIVEVDGKRQDPDKVWPDNTNPALFNETPDRFLIGSSYDSTLGYYNQSDGTIDEFRIYDTTMTEDQFYGDMINDYDIFYREFNQTSWSPIKLVSNESNFMALNPSITEIGSKAYIGWSQADGRCDLESQTYYYCALFRTVSSMYNGTFHQSEVVNDESTGDSFYPHVHSYLNKIFYIWEDSSYFTGTDQDIQFRVTTNSSRPVVNITSDLNSRTFVVTNFSASSQNISLNATASDLDSAVQNVTFYYTADGITGGIACVDVGTTSPYSCSWNIMGVAEDYYQIKAVATSDDSGRGGDINENSFYIDSSPGVITYLLNTSSPYNAGYYNGYLNWTDSARPNISKDNTTQWGLAFSSEMKNNVSGLDNTHAFTSHSPFCQDGEYINSQVFVFGINESSSDVKTLDIYWNGRGYEQTSYYTNLSIWNFNTGAWQPLRFKDFVVAEEDTLRYTITEDIPNYLDPSLNRVFVLAETEDHKGFSCPINPPSCPVYYSWNGSNYVFETEGLPGLLNRQMESTTYDRLYRAAPVDGMIKVKISEIIPEVLYLNMVELISVDSPKDAEVYLDPQGNAITITDSQPVLCVDSLGNDCTSLVAEPDESPVNPDTSFSGGLTSSRSILDGPPLDYEGNAWISDLKNLDLDEDTYDYLYLILPDPGEESSSGKAKLVISGSETGLMSFSELLLFGLGKDSLPSIYDAIDRTILGRIMYDKILGSAKLTIQVLDDNGKWTDYPADFSNAVLGSYETLVLPLDRSIIKGNKIRIKMTAFSYMIDYIAVDYSDDEEVMTERLPASLSQLNDLDDSRIAVISGESIDLSFDVPEERPGMKRTYFLSTAGYYHPLESFVYNQKDTNNDRYGTNIIDISKVLMATPLYAKMYADSDFGRRYFIERYLKADFDKILADPFGFINDLRNSNDEKDEKYLSSEAGKADDSGSETAQEEKDKYLNNVHHNTLYTNFIKMTVSICSVPTNNMIIDDDTILCSGTYHRPDSDYTESGKKGIMRITGSNLVLNCNNSLVVGSGSGTQGNGYGIFVNNSNNVLIKNCNISGYENGIEIKNSRNVSFINSELNNNYQGAYLSNTNLSYIKDSRIVESGHAGISFADNASGNTIQNNTIFDNRYGIYIQNSDANIISQNNITNTVMGNFLGGIALLASSDRNRIDNNTIKKFTFGLMVGDVKRYDEAVSYGKAGMWNNFSRTVLDNNTIGLALIFPKYDDYFNYFEQSNRIKGEPVYYYVNLHGNSSDYGYVSGLSLNAPNTSLSAGKITLVNASYVNVTSNSLSNNSNGIVVVNSSNVIVTSNLLANMSDISQFYSIFGEHSGAGVRVVSSEDITITNNTARGNLFGFALLNESIRITMANNTAESSRFSGIFAEQINDSDINNNTAFLNSPNGMLFYRTDNSTISGNTIRGNSYGLVMNHSLRLLSSNHIFENSIAGLFIPDCRNISFDSNIIENNTGSGVLLKDCTGAVLEGITSSNNSLAGIQIKDSSNIILRNIEADYNKRGMFYNNTNTTYIYRLSLSNNTGVQALFFSSLGNFIIDSIIINDVSAEDINSSGASSNYILNTTFNKSNAVYGDAASNLSVMWHLDFLVLDNESYAMMMSIPVSEVNISVRDVLGDSSFVRTRFTNSYGYSYFNVSEYSENSSARTYYSNYTWNLTKQGYNFTDNLITPYITSTNMSTNRFINLSMLLRGGFDDTFPPTLPYVVDGPDYIDDDWISNRTTLKASWYNSTDRHLIFYSFIIFGNGTCLPGYCAETSTWLNNSVTVTGLNLTEGVNYTFAVRARDSLFWYTPLIYSDGAIADFTKPNITINSTTHPNQSQWYNDANVTMTFYGNDSMSGIAGFSYVLDQNPGTGPDLIAESKAKQTLAEAANTGYHQVIKTNSTGEAFAIFSEVNGNLTVGDNVTVTVQLSEDTSDREDVMRAKVYLVDKSETFSQYDKTFSGRISTIATINEDVTSKNYASSDTYTVTVAVTSRAVDSFFVAVAGDNADDDNLHNLSIAGSMTKVDNSTEVFLCGESTACKNQTNSTEYSISVTREINSDVWTRSYTNLAPGTHYFHARALDVAGNWGEAEHFRIQIDAEPGAPEFVSVKPRGYVASVNPTLAVVTSEYATCYYNATNSSYVLMTSYDGINHKSDLSLSEGTYDYGFNCTDKSGNSAYNATTFIIDPSALPDTVTIWPMTNYTAGQKITAYVNVTKQYNGVSYGLGELSSRFSANVTNSSSSTSGVPLKVVDKGGGLYRIEFTSPFVEGTYTLKVGVAGITDTETFVVNSYSLTISYTGSTDVATTETRMAYGKSNNEYYLGFAVDADPASISASTSQILLKYTAISGNGFIFMTDPLGSPDAVSEYINDGTFLDLKNPAFGHDLNEISHIISTILDYDNIQIIGDDTVFEGRYSLLIRNDGVNTSSGKTKITIAII